MAIGVDRQGEEERYDNQGKGGGGNLGGSDE